MKNHQAVMEFLISQDKTAVQCFKDLQNGIGTECKSKVTVIRWYRDLKTGNGVERKAGNGRPKLLRNAVNIFKRFRVCPH